ncbi:MAG: hypothetical protein AAF689_18710 [Pseudomonadota bacterium]
MNSKIFLALAVLTGPALVPTTAMAEFERTVVCADGSVHHLSGDEITDDMVCASRGGLSPSQIPTAGGIKQGGQTPIKPRPPRQGVATLAPQKTQIERSARPSR